VTAPPLAARRGAPARPRLSTAVTAAALAGAVVLFWWGATGVLLALQRSAGTRLLALALAAGAAAAGLWLTARVAAGARGGDDATGDVADAAAGDAAGAGARAVLAGALLWTCVSAAFYGGWVVGPPVAPPADAGTLGRAARAVAATGYSAVLALALLVAARRLARRAPDRRAGDAAAFAPLTLATLWAAHELAKLNVFLGVANPGAELLPDYLAPLRAYFGPARNSPLLAPSVAVLACAAALSLGAAGRTRTPARRAGYALVAAVLALAALEHALLGARAPVGWWDAFLDWRAAR
jgi:putative photosynthetic complex assembly protein 2